MHETKTLKKAGDIIREAFELYQKQYHTLLSISAFIIIPSLLVSVFFQKGILLSVAGTFGLLFTILCGSILGVLFIVISSWGQIALIYSAKESSLTVSGAFALAWEKLLSYWWIMFLIGFLVLGGIMLFIIPGFLFAIWFSMAYFVLAMEDEKGMNALLKSREYIKGRAWSVFWRYLVLSFCTLLFGIPVSILFGGFPEPWGGIITQNVFSFLVVPFNVMYMFLLYRSLVETKGEFSFVPKQKTKRIFIALGWFGILLPIILIVSLWKFLPPEKLDALIPPRIDMTQKGFNSFSSAVVPFI